MMKVNVQKLIAKCSEVGVNTLPGLAEYFKKAGVKVSERTLYNWQRGGGFQSSKIDLVADQLGIQNPIDLIEIAERS